MIGDYFRTLLGLIKFLIYKLIYFNRINFKSIPLVSSTSRIIIRKNSKLIIGKKIRIRDNCCIRLYGKSKMSIGDNCFFNDNFSANCQDKIEIGNNCLFGNNISLIDNDHDYKNNIKNYITKPIKIGNNVWIGSNVTILKGVTIGDGCTIASGSIVINDVENNSLYYNKITPIIKKNS